MLVVLISLPFDLGGQPHPRHSQSQPNLERRNPRIGNREIVDVVWAAEMMVVLAAVLP